VIAGQIRIELPISKETDVAGRDALVLRLQRAHTERAAPAHLGAHLAQEFGALWLIQYARHVTRGQPRSFLRHPRLRHLCARLLGLHGWNLEPGLREALFALAYLRAHVLALTLEPCRAAIPSQWHVVGVLQRLDPGCHAVSHGADDRVVSHRPESQ